MTSATYVGRVARNWLWLIVLSAAVAGGVAYGLVTHATKTYEAQAQLLVSPVSGDTALSGLGLLHESNDPGRDTETASRLVTTNGVAALVRHRLGARQSSTSLLGQVSAEPIAQSDLVAVIGRARSPRRAQAIANGFAQATLDARAAEFNRRIDERIQQVLAETSGHPAAGSPGATDLATLQALRQAGDPTLQMATGATVPRSPVSPRPALTIAAALIGGLVLGLGAALALERLAPRLRSESVIRERYGVPVLSRIPAEAVQDTPPVPGQVSPAARRAFRTLQAMVTASRSGRRAVFVTEAGGEEGTPSTAVNLAMAAAESGQRVLLIDANVQRPGREGVLDTAGEPGLVEVLLSEVPLRGALVPVSGFGGRLLVLTASGRSDPGAADYLMLPSASRLLAQAKRLVPLVVVDGPPLLETIEASPLARSADEVLVVARLGRSRLNLLDNLFRQLERDGCDVVGIAAIAAPRRLRRAWRAATGWARRHPMSLPEASGGLAPDRARGPVA